MSPIERNQVEDPRRVQALTRLAEKFSGLTVRQRYGLLVQSGVPMSIVQEIDCGSQPIVFAANVESKLLIKLQELPVVSAVNEAIAMGEHVEFPEALQGEWAQDNLEYPEEIRKHIKLRNSMVMHLLCSRAQRSEWLDSIGIERTFIVGINLAGPPRRVAQDILNKAPEYQQLAILEQAVMADAQQGNAR